MAEFKINSEISPKFSKFRKIFGSLRFALQMMPRNQIPAHRNVLEPRNPQTNLPNFETNLTIFGSGMALRTEFWFLGIIYDAKHDGPKTFQKFENFGIISELALNPVISRVNIVDDDTRINQIKLNHQ